MQSYTVESYGEAISPVFDAVNDDPAEVARIVAFLRGYAGAGPVLEPGIGTGRIGVPLAESGVEVYGVEISRPMVEQLRAKPGASLVTVEIGDMAEVGFGRQFSLIYLAQGTFGALLTAEQQGGYLEYARKQLTDDGLLVVETMEIDDSRFSHDQHVTTSLLDVGHVVLTAAMREPDTQLMSIQNVLLTAHGIQLYPVKFRYHAAPELDGMAAEAGLRLVDRFSDWEKAGYTPGDLRHISVYGPS